MPKSVAFYSEGVKLAGDLFLRQRDRGGHVTGAGVSAGIDMALTLAARIAGQEVAEFPGDLGYFVGRIHTSGSLAASGLTTDIEMEVVGNGRVDISENELEIWYSPQDRFEVSLRPPGGEWLGPYQPRQFLENHRLGPTEHFVSVYNELYHPSNGANYIAIYLSPFFDPKCVVGVKSGTWTVRLHGLEIRNGAFHGWIERDDLCVHALGLLLLRGPLEYACGPI